ncbi:MAG: hypothetical protein ACFCVK_06495 [Acidimicrobiales bacterium]
MGLRFTFRLYAANVLRPDPHSYDADLDRRLGVDTTGAWDYPTDARPWAEAEGYEATRVDVARYAFGLLSIDIDTAELWDLGSGKGRITVLAAEHGFKRSVGVECNEELHRVATANVEAARAVLPPVDIELLSCSATEVTWPDQPLVVFMFNPFGGHVFDQVVASLEARARRGRRSLHVIYVNPRERERLDRSPVFELLAEERLPTPWTTLIYGATGTPPLDPSVPGT